MAAGETILYYNPDEEASMRRLAGVLFPMKIRIRKVTAEEARERVGYLAGLPDFEKSGTENGTENDVESGGEVPSIDEEVMVMSNLSNSRLNELLASMKKAGIPRIALKAMLTPTNCKWTFYELYQELKQEHEAMSQTKQ